MYEASVMVVHTCKQKSKVMKDEQNTFCFEVYESSLWDDKESLDAQCAIQLSREVSL